MPGWSPRRARPGDGVNPARGPRRTGSDDGALIAARPASSPGTAALTSGTQPVGTEAVRDSLLRVPRGLQPGKPAPLLVALHGAGGSAEGGLALLAPVADAYGLVLLAPASRGSTWDAIRAGYGPDVDVVDRALSQVFRTVPVDPERVGVAGFSDGASYALGLGLANGELFSRVVAFSPGFVPPGPRIGHPAVFVSHGDDDRVLPVVPTSRRIVPSLRQEGYDVTYEEFAGGHTVPRDVIHSAVEWLGKRHSPR